MCIYIYIYIYVYIYIYILLVCGLSIRVVRVVIAGHGDRNAQGVGGHLVGRRLRAAARRTKVPKAAPEPIYIYIYIYTYVLHLIHEICSLGRILCITLCVCCVYICIYIYIYIHTQIYIYIYIYRERERYDEMATIPHEDVHAAPCRPARHTE